MELQVEATFHGVAYLLTVSTIEGETLCVEVEQKSDCSRWRGDFTSRCEGGPEGAKLLHMFTHFTAPRLQTSLPPSKPVPLQSL